MEENMEYKINESTKNFCDIWIDMIKDGRNCTQELTIKELEIQEEKFKKAKFFIEQGADINAYGYFTDYEKCTAILCIIDQYYIRDTNYMNDEFLDNMLSFLFENNVIADEESIIFTGSSIRDIKLFEELLKRTDKLEFRYSMNFIFLEIILGFNIVKLDKFISYEFSYVNDDDAINFKNYDYLPIECVLLDYSTERGLKIITDDGRKQIITLLKRYGSPNPCLSRLETMICMHEDKEKNKEKKEKLRKRFEECYNYWNKLE
jgi:hypothetical protein